MDNVKVSKRDFSLNAKKLRDAGLVPGCVYGGALTETICLQMALADVNKLLASKRLGSRAQLDLDGEIIPVQIKEKDVDAITNKVNNINFQALKAGQKVKSVVHVLLKNADKITDTLEHMVTEIPYSALPKDMIDTITIDVDGMGAGTTVEVGDIKELQSDKIELLINKDEPVFKIYEKKTAPAETEEATEDAE